MTKELNGKPKQWRERGLGKRDRGINLLHVRHIFFERPKKFCPKKFLNRAKKSKSKAS